MARIWKEQVGTTTRTNLIPREIIFVRVASFTFSFKSEQQLRECLQFFQKKVHPSSRIPAKVLADDIGPDWQELRSWEVERWFERLPMYLLEEPKRQKVEKALSHALDLIHAGKI